MKHNVNFYFDEFKPKKQIISLQKGLILVGLTTLLIIFFALSSAQQAQQKQQSLEQMRQLVTEKRALVSEFENALQNRKLDPKLTELIAQLQKKIEIKQQITEQIQHRSQNQINGYSQLMADLSQTMPTGIWLNKISFSDDQIELTGATQQAQLLPKWLQKLEQSSYFNDREFNNLQLNSMDNKNLTTFNVISSVELEVNK